MEIGIVRWFGILLISIFVPVAAAADCGTKRLCKEMRNCAEATYHLRVCGLARFDRDRDGIPCERLCGKTASTHARRLAAQTGGRDLAKMFATASTINGLVSAVEPAKTYTCVVRKRYCKEMDTCAEARFYLTKCGISSLDGNRDGIPCNSLCRTR